MLLFFMPWYPCLVIPQTNNKHLLRNSPNLLFRTFQTIPKLRVKPFLLGWIHFPFHASKDFIESSDNTMDFPRTRSLCTSKRRVIFRQPCHPLIHNLPLVFSLHPRVLHRP